MTAASYPKSHIVSPTTPHTHTIIFLHGRGSNALEFGSELFESQASNAQFFTQIFPSLKWVFPCAPLQRASLENEDMHQWFDISSVRDALADPEMQRPGLRESVQRLVGIIEDEAREVGKERIVLAGISQGCATAIYALLTSGMRLGGFVGLAGWMPLGNEAQQIIEDFELVGNVCDMPVLLQHCRDDGVVPVESGEELKLRLEDVAMGVQWECFEEGGHWLNEPEGVDGIVRFVRGVMASKSR